MTKIEESLSHRVKREETVIYILVQIYKILETDNERSKYPVLEFFRNWVAHNELDRKNAQTVLEDYIEKNAELKYNFLTFEMLREEMAKFLACHNLPKFIINEGWFQFRRKLIEVIRDQPILKNTRYTPSDGSVYLKELRITGPSEMFERSLISFDLNLSDGTNVGGSIMLGDKDEMAKKYDRLNDIWFRHHYNRKAFLKVGEARRNAIDDGNMSKLNHMFEELHEKLKEDEVTMAALRTEIDRDEFNDEYYK